MSRILVESLDKKIRERAQNKLRVRVHSTFAQFRSWLRLDAESRPNRKSWEIDQDTLRIKLGDGSWSVAEVLRELEAAVIKRDSEAAQQSAVDEFLKRYDELLDGVVAVSSDDQVEE